MGMWKVIGRIVVLTLALPFLILALPVLFVWACVRLCCEGCRTGRPEVDEDVRLMQRIHSDMVRMDRRVESLETLLLRESSYRRAPYSTA
jgi:hypothetical protein